MEGIYKFLRTAECHFNWNLSAINFVNVDLKERWKELVERHNKWHAKLSLAFLLFPLEKEKASEIVDSVVTEVLESSNKLISKYRIPFLHICYSFKAFVLLGSGKEEEARNLLKEIKPFSDMSPIEKSALLFVNGDVLMDYGAQGVYKAVPLLRQSIRLNPEEYEFKLSLVVCMNNIRGYDINLKPQISQHLIDEPKAILEQLLKNPELDSSERENCEFLLAKIFNDCLLRLERSSSQYKLYKTKILDYCIIYDDDHPARVSFRAERLFFLGNDRSKGLQIVKDALEKFPRHINVNTVAAKMYRALNDFESAALYAQVALDTGGYGAAWILLESKLKLDPNFDDEEFFDHLITFFPQRNEIMTHLNASLYYFEVKLDVVKGARHLTATLVEDPAYFALKKLYSQWSKQIVSPLELAYFMIARELKLVSHCEEDVTVLQDAKSKIEEVLAESEDSESRDKGLGWRTGKGCARQSNNGKDSGTSGCTRSTNWRDECRSTSSSSSANPPSRWKTSNSNWRDTYEAPRKKDARHDSWRSACRKN